MEEPLPNESELIRLLIMGEAFQCDRCGAVEEGSPAVIIKMGVRQEGKCGIIWEGGWPGEVGNELCRDCKESYDNWLAY